MIAGIAALLSLGLTVAAFAIKRTTLFAASAIAWIIFSLYFYSIHTVAWDIPFMLFWFGIAMMIVMIIEAIIAWDYDRRQDLKEKFREKEEHDQELSKEQRGMHPMDIIRAKHGLPPSEARETQKEKRKLGW